MVSSDSPYMFHSPRVSLIVVSFDHAVKGLLIFTSEWSADVKYRFPILCHFELTGLFLHGMGYLNRIFYT